MYPAETVERVIRELRANPVLTAEITELIIKQIEDDIVDGQKFVADYLKVEEDCQ